MCIQSNTYKHSVRFERPLANSANPDQTPHKVSHMFPYKMLYYEGLSKSSDRYVVALSRDIFERHTMHNLKEQVFTVIMMLVCSRCTVWSYKYITLYITHSITLACFHVIKL